MAPNNQPLVSVVIPVYNGERFLAEAVASVRAQNYAPLEIIIVDDGSTDGTAELVRGLGDDIQYVYQPNAGPAAARNRGLELARGEIIAFQDADDVWADDKLAGQLALLRQYPAAGVVLGATRLIQMNERAPGSGASGMVAVLQAALFRRSVFEQVGLLNEQLRLSEDTDWYLRAIEQGVQIITHRQIVLFYRRHGANLTQNSRDTTAHLLLALKRSLNRRRQATGQSVEPPTRVHPVLPESSVNL